MDRKQKRPSTDTKTNSVICNKAL